MIKGLRAVRTSTTFFADDDVFWAPTLLSHFLAPFEDPKVGAVGGLQTLERKQHPNCWDFLGTIYLERRKFELAATNSVDGGVGCLSGRTLAIRTGIIQNEQFISQLLEEKWLGFLPLVAADDDNFVTRYLVNHGWKIAIQFTKEAELTTTLEDNPKFLAQCIRWRRTTWRSNFTSLFIDRVIWRDQPWSTYALHLSSFNPPALIMDPLLGYSLFRAIEASGPDSCFPSISASLVLFLLWVAFTKTVKSVGHFRQYPADLKFLPLFFFTLQKTGWGGGRSEVVSDDEKHGEDGLRPSAPEDIEAGSTYAELKRARCSGIDIHLLGEKVKGLTNLSRAASPVFDLELGGKNRLVRDPDML
ncbi:MAG: hypothetical protein Q9171_003103 [Xanthocarpia ochracea]